MKDIIMEIQERQKIVDALIHSNDIDLLKKFAIKIDSFNFSSRTANTLFNNYIVFVGDIIRCTEKEFSRKSHMGPKTIVDIKNTILAPLNLHFGMAIFHWPSINSNEKSTILEHIETINLLTKTLVAKEKSLMTRVTSQDISRAVVQNPLLNPTSPRGRLFMRRAGLLKPK